MNINDDRPCTCHPADNPPVPCARRYALGECLKSVAPQRQLTWPSQAEQLAYWENRDKGGNIISDRIEANEWRYDPENFYGAEFQTLGEYETDAERNA